MHVAMACLSVAIATPPLTYVILSVEILPCSLCVCVCVCVCVRGSVFSSAVEADSLFCVQRNCDAKKKHQAPLQMLPWVTWRLYVV